MLTAARQPKWIARIVWMVGLITAQRYFQANAKAIDTATQLSQTIVNLRT